MNIKQPFACDLSHWNPAPDFREIYPVPYLVITKATEGVNYVDPTFVDHMAGMKQIGCHRGAYHFFRKAYDGAGQARLFIAVVNGYIDDETILVLDTEEGGESAEQLWGWFDTVRRAYQKNRVMLYGRKLLLDPIPMDAAQAQYFRGIPVWTAGYPNNPDLFSTVPTTYVPDPLKYGPVYLWQYSETGRVDGIGGAVDLDWVSPNLQLFLGQPQPPQEVTMSQWYRVNTAGLNIRKGPGASYEKIGLLVQDDRIEVIDTPVGGWLHIKTILPTGIGGAYDAPADSWCSGAYCVKVEPPITPPVTADKVPFTLTQTVKIDGFKEYTFSHSGELEKA